MVRQVTAKSRFARAVAAVSDWCRKHRHWSIRDNECGATSPITALAATFDDCDLAADGMTMLLVTHEMSFARDVSARVVFMDAGRVAVQGTPREVFIGQNHDRLRRFLSRIEMRH